MSSRAESRLTFWQRRYVLGRYRDWSDEHLARGSGLSTEAVRAFLVEQGATRSHADARRIVAETANLQPPILLSPGVVLRRLTRLRSRPLVLWDGVLLALLLAGSLLLYGLTAARTVTGEDAGELLAAAHGFGVPHPPGYPLWLLLSWSFDHSLPFGTTALRVSLVSAFFSALANTLLLALALKTLRHRAAAVTAAALFAVSRTHWTQAVIPEVYGLHIAFVAGHALLLVRLAEKPSTGRLLALAALTGFSLTNHTSAVPLGLATAVAALFIAPRLFRQPLAVMGAGALTLLPLLLYFVLPLASARDPYVDWGNPETTDALWAHVSRDQYASVESDAQARDDLQARWERLVVLGTWAGRQFGSPWVLLLAGVGFLTLPRRQTGPWLHLFFVAFLSSIVVVRYTAFSFDREHVYANQIFWIPAWLVLAWWIGGALDALFGSLVRLTEPMRGSASLLVHAGLVGLVLLPASQNYALADRSETKLIERYGRSLLAAMEPGTLYFPSSDHSTFGVMYLQGVLGQRPDIVIADRYGMIDEALLEKVMSDEDRARLASASGSEQRRLREEILIERWPGPVAFANKRDTEDIDGRTLEPAGPLFRLLTREQADAFWHVPAEGGESPGLAMWSALDPVADVREAEALDFTVQMVQSDLLYMKGFALLRAGRLDEAILIWQALDADLAPLKQLFNNVGSALAEHSRLVEAEAFYRRALNEDPDYVLALKNLALVSKKRGDPRSAIECLERLVVLERKETRAVRWELAQLLADDERYAEALAQYEWLANADRKDPLPWREAGLLLHEIGDSKKAEDAFREALRLDPHDMKVASALDRLKRGQGVEAVGPEVLEPPGSDDPFHGPGALGPPNEIGPRLGLPGLRLEFDPQRPHEQPGRP
ncbi:MAG: protein O-mannosyl-transferase family [Planctomycetota bacterium]